MVNRIVPCASVINCESCSNFAFCIFVLIVDPYTIGKCVDKPDISLYANNTKIRNANECGNFNFTHPRLHHTDTPMEERIKLEIKKKRNDSLLHSPPSVSTIEDPTVVFTRLELKAISLKYGSDSNIFDASGFLHLEWNDTRLEWVDFFQAFTFLNESQISEDLKIEFSEEEIWSPVLTAFKGSKADWNLNETRLIVSKTGTVSRSIPVRIQSTCHLPLLRWPISDHICKFGVSFGSNRNPGEVNNTRDPFRLELRSHQSARQVVSGGFLSLENMSIDGRWTLVRSEVTKNSKDCRNCKEPNLQFAFTLAEAPRKDVSETVVLVLFVFIATPLFLWIKRPDGFKFLYALFHFLFIVNVIVTLHSWLPKGGSGFPILLLVFYLSLPALGITVTLSCFLQILISFRRFVPFPKHLLIVTASRGFVKYLNLQNITMSDIVAMTNGRGNSSSDVQAEVVINENENDNEDGIEIPLEIIRTRQDEPAHAQASDHPVVSSANVDASVDPSSHESEDEDEETLARNFELRKNTFRWLLYAFVLDRMAALIYALLSTFILVTFRLGWN